MQLDGTNGADATFSFRPCPSNQYCDFKDVQTFQNFQRKDSAFAIPNTERKKAYCVNRWKSYTNMYAGATCSRDYQCRSGRCWGRRCIGQFDNEQCIINED
mmetsp:Transcript_14752/g.12973  ORF Transcript_14752/g.12973 Transcript_14752/m.12973 type:complete len:101 (-) Transcript_14752:885-1187(-)